MKVEVERNGSANIEQVQQTAPTKERIESLLTDKGFCIFTVTRYESTADLRFRMCMEMISTCLEHDICLVIVDSSPCSDVFEKLSTSGVIVHRQTARGRKGAALREAAEIISKLPGAVAESTILCWQEPEKVDMVRHWHTVRLCFADVMVPYRCPHLFEKTYPIEQYHSETFGNLYLDAVAENELEKIGLEYVTSLDLNVPKDMEHSRVKLPKLDWHFGPLAFKAKHVNLWTNYVDGDSYDAQLVPLVHAMRKGINVKSVYVSYEAPLQMKEEEENNTAFIEKRLAQLNELDPRVKKAWSDPFYC